jgi:murein lipoprotein
MNTNLLKASLIVASIALMTGCASNSDLAAVREQAAQAQRTADEAQATAAAAQQTALEAQQAAEEAKQSANDANTKIDRSFKKAMYK